MLVNTKLAVVSSLALLAVATPVAFPEPAALPFPTGDGGSGGVSQCNVGNMQCCNSVQESSSTGLGSLGGLLGLVLGPITGLIGLSCSPINILGLGSSGCSANPVCCSNVQFNGLISLGCFSLDIL